MSQAPFMQLYVGDYLADTTDLTTEQHGAYLLLLMTMWRHGAELPDDAKKLARIARVSPRRWHLIWAEIEHFFTVEGGKVLNARLSKEYQKAVSISQKRSVSGARGGAAKALKTNDAPLASATDLLKHSQRSDIIKKKSTNVLSSDCPDLASCFSAYNEAAERTGWPKVQVQTKPRIAALKARIKDCGGVDAFIAAIERAAQSHFLTGQSDRQFMASFDWITKPANFTKIMEGNYDNRTHPAGPTNGGRMAGNQGTGGGGQGGSLTGALLRLGAAPDVSPERQWNDTSRDAIGLRVVGQS